ncbi:MAG: hypothetical protein IKW23_03430, partial [Kiritimatiellae bacterium]|nr:hypothetical protein [Kiritimatiellia bacterium]
AVWGDGGWGHSHFAPTSVKASQEARSICLGRSEPRLPSRLCGKPSWQCSSEAPVPGSAAAKRPWVWPCHRGGVGAA